MRYGPNTKLVEEVLELVKSGDLFVPTDNQLENVHYIDNFDEAKLLAWEKTFGEGGLLWTDVREEEMSLVKEKMYTLKDYAEIRESLLTNLKKFTMYLRRQLKRSPYEELLDDVIADFYNCTVNRAVYGMQDNFYNQIFQIYKNGGWPCGWNGNYPNGQLIAYSPET